MFIALLNALGFRARGGLGEKWGWRLPLCKWWFAVIWTGCFIYLTKYNEKGEPIELIVKGFDYNENGEKYEYTYTSHISFTEKYKTGISSNDADEISNYIIKLMKDEKEYNKTSNNSKELFDSKFNAEKIYKELASYLEKIEKEYRK